MTITDTTQRKDGPRAPASGGRLPELDVIRVVASLVVVLWHYTFSGWAQAEPATHVRFVGFSQVIRYGYFAPQLFFFISGFVIMGVAVKDTPRAFFRARAFRVIPLFWTMCTITWLVSRHHPTLGPLSGTTYGLNMTFLVGIIGGHFVDAVYWTLTVEIAFYALVWLAMVTGALKHWRRLLPIWLVAGLAIELAGRHQGGLFEHVAFLMRWNGCFAAGICCWSLRRERHDPYLWVIVAISTFLAARSVYIVASDFRAHLQPGVALSGWIGAIGVSVGFAGMLWLALTRPPGGNLSPAAAKRWGVIGGLTYPVYLLHENVGLTLIDRFDWVNRWLLLVAVIALIVAVSWLLMRFVERPAIAWLKRHSPI